ncbi:MAG: DUF1761 domain-containing protein [Planctomycetota bacterium]
MNIDFGAINWLAIVVCVVVGQIFLTVWFVALFAKPWARAYGVDDAKQHSKEIPGYTYGIGALCVFLLSLGLAGLQQGLGVKTAVDGLVFGGYAAACLCVATALPGYAFLKRWRAGALAIGSQAALIVILSLILALWK